MLHFYFENFFRFFHPPLSLSPSTPFHPLKKIHFWAAKYSLQRYFFFHFKILSGELLEFFQVSSFVRNSNLSEVSAKKAIEWFYEKRMRLKSCLRFNERQVYDFIPLDYFLLTASFFLFFFTFSLSFEVIFPTDPWNCTIRVRLYFSSQLDSSILWFSPFFIYYYHILYRVRHSWNFFIHFTCEKLNLFALLEELCAIIRHFMNWEIRSVLHKLLCMSTRKMSAFWNPCSLCIRVVEDK